MSIASAIQNARTKIAAAYTACNNKGATMPSSGSQNLSNLATTIDSISTGSPFNQTIQKWIKTEDNGVVSYSRDEEVVGNITSIVSNKYKDDTSLVSVLIPDTVVSLSSASFRGCSNLQYVNLENLTEIGWYAFQDTAFCADIYAPKLEWIYSNAFRSTSVSKVLSLGQITVLGSANQEGGVFQDCVNLFSVVLPDTLTTIWQCNFWGCTNLHTLTIPASVTTISGYWGLFNRTYLTEVTILATTPPAMTGGGSRSNSIPGLSAIYVPAESVTAYQSATNWSAFASIIQAIP